MRHLLHPMFDSMYCRICMYSNKDGGGGGGGAKLVKKASSDIDKYMFEDDNDNLDIGSVMSSDVNSGFSLAEKAKELTDQVP